MPTLDTGTGATLHYEDAGRGAPVVLVHGWSLSSAVFEAELDALAARGRAIAPDLRGHGRSPPAPFTLDDLAADLAALLERLALARVVLVGWSLGAQVALAALPRVRGRLAGVVLVSATPRFTRGDGWPHGLPARSVEVLAERVRRAPGPALARFFDELFAAGELDGPARDRVRALRAAIPLPDPAAAADGLAALRTADLRPRLDDLAASGLPALVVHGGADPICVPSAGRAIADRVPGARLAILPAVGHAPFLSRPGEFRDLLLGFAGALA
jgi:pimeloyl-ACP methyl ester esterase